MPTQVNSDDVTRMSEALFIEKSWRSPSASKFWVLLVLATVIATSGVIADSTASYFEGVANLTVDIGKGAYAGGVLVARTATTCMR